MLYSESQTDSKREYYSTITDNSIVINDEIEFKILSVHEKAL